MTLKLRSCYDTITYFYVTHRKSGDQASVHAEQNTEEDYIEDQEEEDERDEEVDTQDTEEIILNDETLDSPIDVPEEIDNKENEEIVIEGNSDEEDADDEAGDAGKSDSRLDEGAGLTDETADADDKDAGINEDTPDIDDKGNGISSSANVDKRKSVDMIIEMPEDGDEIFIKFNETGQAMQEIGQGNENDETTQEISKFNEKDNEAEQEIEDETLQTVDISTDVMGEMSGNPESWPDIIITQPGGDSSKHVDDWETFRRPAEPQPDYDAESHVESDDVSLVLSMEGDASTVVESPERPAMPRIRSLFSRALSLRMMENMASRIVAAASEHKQVGKHVGTRYHDNEISSHLIINFRISICPGRGALTIHLLVYTISMTKRRPVCKAKCFTSHVWFF